MVVVLSVASSHPCIAKRRISIATIKSFLVDLICTLETRSYMWRKEVRCEGYRQYPLKYEFMGMVVKWTQKNEIKRVLDT